MVHRFIASGAGRCPILSTDGTAGPPSKAAAPPALPTSMPGTVPATVPVTDGGPGAAQPWWQSAAIYQIYPRSFCDTTGNGIGDLAGARRHLDHLQWLGVDAIWLSPIYVSPMADGGYDVADYCDVDPLFGSLGDFDELQPRPTSSASECSSTGCPTTRATSTPGSSSPSRHASPPSASGTTGGTAPDRVAHPTTGPTCSSEARRGPGIRPPGSGT